VDLLETAGGALGGQADDLVQQRLRVLVAGPQALEVQHAEAAELADADRRGRRDDRVHGSGQERQLEAVGVDLPGDRDLLRVPRTAAGDDGDVVEGVRPAAALAAPDLDLSHVCGLSLMRLQRLPVSPTAAAPTAPDVTRGRPRMLRSRPREARRYWRL